MIVLGTYLAQVPLGSLFKESLAYRCTFVRLILIPLLTALLLRFFPAEYHTLKLAILIAASTPVGTNVAIFAQLYGQDYTHAVKEVCLSTLLCIATLPLIIGFADYILCNCSNSIPHLVVCILALTGYHHYYHRRFKNERSHK